MQNSSGKDARLLSRHVGSFLFLLLSNSVGLSKESSRLCADFAVDGRIFLLVVGWFCGHVAVRGKWLAFSGDSCKDGGAGAEASSKERGRFS